MTKRIGFLINPIAGMGGRVGLKGTDGVVDEARRLGARPVAGDRAFEALSAIARQASTASGLPRICWLTCAGAMGEEVLLRAGFEPEDIVVTHRAATDSGASDTRAAVESFLERGVDLVLFCGGDGTARDICVAAGTRIPILGIPSGVKMYSGVFGTTPARTAEILVAFLEDRLTISSVDVLDLDETRYRADTWHVRLYYRALTPFEPSLTQSAKALIEVAGEEEVKDAIAETLRERFTNQSGLLVLLGPGSSVQSVAAHLGLEKTLLGIDAMADGEPVGRDLNECQILELLARYPRRVLVLSPIGAQGFVLGRGNLPLSPEVIRAVGRDNIIVIATPAKLARTPVLRFDTGDCALDQALATPGYLQVLIGYRRRRLVKVMV